MSSWRKPVFVSIATAIFLWLASIWVPIVPKDYANYRNVSLFKELKPRALLGTFADFFGFGAAGFNLLLTGALYVLLFTILVALWSSVFGKRIDYKQGLLTFSGVGFIFAFSTVTFMTFGPATIIDVAAYTFIALAAALIYHDSKWPNWLTTTLANLLLIVAVMIHEKSLFDIAILGTWLLWKSGLRKTLLYLAPGTLISLVFLASVSSETTSGLSPTGYFAIVSGGFTFMHRWSLNIWGIIIGGGSLWALYYIFAREFFRTGISRKDARHRLVLVNSMLLICLSALLIAADTNRIAGMIWLPTFLLMHEIDVGKIFRPAIARIGLLGLCVFQLLLPPALIYNNGIAPFNCYGVRLITKLQLPMQRDVKPDEMGPFGLYIANHPQIMQPIIARCLPASGTF